jgi:hypothetical protein
MDAVNVFFFLTLILFTELIPNEKGSRFFFLVNKNNNKRK